MRDFSERGRDIEGVIKQWFGFVKPSYRKYVEPQRTISGNLSPLSNQSGLELMVILDIIIPRGIENKTAIGMFPSIPDQATHYLGLNTFPLRHGGQTYPTQATREVRET